MGRERQRGKLADLNAFLRGGARERFCLVEGGLDGLALVRYVIAPACSATAHASWRRRWPIR